VERRVGTSWNGPSNELSSGTVLERDDAWPRPNRTSNGTLKGLEGFDGGRPVSGLSSEPSTGKRSNGLVDLLRVGRSASRWH
jgi:hypothetical protein